MQLLIRLIVPGDGHTDASLAPTTDNGPLTPAGSTDNGQWPLSREACDSGAAGVRDVYQSPAGQGASDCIELAGDRIFRCSS